MKTEELANIIGVSRVTLSKVINGKSGVSRKTEDKIKEYIDQYNFKPNSQARSLAGKKEKVIGLFTTFSEDVLSDNNITSHFSSVFTNHVIAEAQKRDYKTLVCITSTEEEFDEIERYFNSGLIIGAILLGFETGNKKIKMLAEKKHPMVLVNQEEHSKYENISLLNMNDEKWAFYAIERLVNYGHENILYLGSSLKRLPAMRRAKGVAQAHEKYKARIKNLTVINGDFKEQQGYNIVKRIFSGDLEKPTGIFAANDLMAIGALTALKELGIETPNQVSIIGFDDIEVSRYLTPALSTIKCDFKELAKIGVNELIGMIEKKTKSKSLELDLEFIDRDTLGGIIYD